MKKYWPLIREFFQRADIVLFLLCLTSAIFGLVVISSATATSTEGSAHYVLIQSLSLVIGVALFVALTVLDIDVIADKWPLLYLVSAVLLLLLIPFGYDDGTGNKSWLRFLGIGIQPSEIIKVIFIIVLS
ncbi:MAG: FtsW/RodA/SpoVE family cell cycle protein, partial [Oscillospiraceae bacterium]|nr:FtsW/RodA/SpoVE family cell cycle protein [Oscillospiraceae bacterium]